MKDLLIEAKSTFVIPDLLQGTKDVAPWMYKEIMSSPLRITKVDVEKSLGMNMIRYTGRCEEEIPIITFYDYKPQAGGAEPEVPASSMLALAFGIGAKPQKPDVDQEKNVVRVACSCNEYYALFAQANYLSSCHHGFKPKAYDARDAGYSKTKPNKLEIPGMCHHLISLHRYLVNVGKVA